MINLAIKIIKDNIKETDEIDTDYYNSHWNRQYHRLLQKYLKLSEKYFNLRDKLDNKIVYKYKE